MVEVVSLVSTMYEEPILVVIVTGQVVTVVYVVRVSVEDGAVYRGTLSVAVVYKIDPVADGLLATDEDTLYPTRTSVLVATGVV